MRSGVGFGSNVGLTFPLLSGLRYFPVSAKHAGRRGRKDAASCMQDRLTVIFIPEAGEPISVVSLAVAVKSQPSVSDHLITLA